MMRYLAQRATTKEWLHTDLLLDVSELRWDLSGSGSLQATVAPDLGTLRGDDGRLLLEEWGTILVAEASGLVRWCGLLVSSKWQGQEWQLECAGLSTYPHGMVFEGTIEAVQIDPAEVVRQVWAHLQEQPDGDLGVEVVGSTTVRVGTEKKDVGFTTGAGEDVSFEAGPYELNWWDAPDCGQEIDTLADSTPFDWVEEHEWNADKSDVLHRVRIGYPRIGRKRTDLQFEQGVNIVETIAPDADGDDFANSIIGIGAGEGKGAIRTTAAVRDGRLRRTYALNRKDIRSKATLRPLVQGELEARKQLIEIPQVTVRDHPSARIGSWQCGDDILVRADIPWVGEISLWHRIVSWALTSESTAQLSLKRSDSFRYGGARG